MGWWGYGVMAGDGPSDVMCSLDDVSGVTKLTKKFEDVEISDKQMSAILIQIKKMVTPTVIKKLIKEVESEAMDDSTIGYQVLGVWMMGYGIKIPATLKKQIILSAKCDDADGFNNPKARKKAIASFVKDLTKYDGKKPTQLKDADQGLFAAVFEHIASGDDGLLNK